MSKRKHKTSSSIATNNESIRDELDEVDLTFTDSNADGIELDTPPPGEASHFEYMRSSELAGMEKGAFRDVAPYSNEIDWSTTDQQEDAKTSAPSHPAQASSSGPEMQERGSSGGLNFMMQHSGRTPRQGAADLPDMELDPPYKGG